MSETRFGTWTAPEASISVEYSLLVIEEIRQAVAEGFQRFARGGIEVGGVLYGTYEGTTARILAVREIVCEHARGPSFVFSDKDRAGLTEQLERDRGDSRLEGFVPLGLYISHTRSDIALLPSDLEIFDSFFSELSHVVLVVRPGRAGTMRAGFFMREADGSIKTERSYLDFNFPDRPATPSPIDRPPRERSSAGERRGVPSLDTQPATEMSENPTSVSKGFTFSAVEPSRTPARAPEYVPQYPPADRNWLPWGIAAAVVLALAIVGVIGWKYFGARTVSEPIALAVYERDSQLRIEWNHEAAPIRTAAKGTLEIVDGTDTQSAVLSSEDLARGSFTYMRRSGDVQIRMEVQNSSGDKTREASRFLGAAPRQIDANELDAVKEERDMLQEEVTRLQEENAKQADHVKQLERTLTILRSRLGIVGPGKK